MKDSTRTLLYIALIYFLFLLFASCSNSKTVSCDAYGIKTIKFPYVDTVYIDQIHIHIEEENLCGWFPGDTLIFHDTIELNLN